MKLSRKMTYHLWLASQIFEKAYKQDEMLEPDQRKLRVNVAARMVIRTNHRAVASEFHSIKEKEHELVTKHHGYFVSGLGITQFFSSEVEREEFIKNERKFYEELGTINEMAQTLSAGNTDILAKLNDDFEAARNKFLKTADPEKAKENLGHYNKEFSEFLNEPKGVKDFKVTPIKAIWFENTFDLPQAFIEHYDEAGLID